MEKSSKRSSKSSSNRVVKWKRGSKTKFVSEAEKHFGSWISKGIDRGKWGGGMVAEGIHSENGFMGF